MLVPTARDKLLLPDAQLFGSTFDDIDPDRVPGTGNALAAVRAWSALAASTKPNGDDAPPTGLAFVGGTGTGKTLLLNALATDLAARLGDNVSSGYRLLVLGEAQLHTHIRRCWEGHDSADRLRRAIAGANRSWLLLDDLGVSTDDERFVKEVGDLLLRRHASRFRTCTVVTTNLTLPRIERIYGARVASRLFETVLTYRLDGDDQRSPTR